MNDLSTRQSYGVVSLEWLAGSGLTSRDGRALVEKRRFLPDATVPIPPIRFGEVERPSGRIPEWPAGGWDEASYSTGDLPLFVIRDALVHGEQGVVTVGPYLLGETAYLANVGPLGFEQSGRASYVKLRCEPDLSIRRAAHVCCGWVGNRNYAHWLVDVMPAVLLPPFGSAFADDTLIMPSIRTGFQRQMLDLMPELGGRAVFAGPNTLIACDELRLVPGILQSDLTPHPSRLVMLDELRRRAVGSAEPATRVYVSRKDAGARRMRNEDDVINLLRAHGFHIAVLSEMSVQEQIATFAGATHVVSAHGAGLANVLFCNPGTMLIEFHMSSSIIWSIRRLAAVAGMHYGCLFGTADDETLPVDARTWTLPIERLEALLLDPSYLQLNITSPSEPPMAVRSAL